LRHVSADIRKFEVIIKRRDRSPAEQAKEVTLPVPYKPRVGKNDPSKLDAIVAKARKAREQRLQGYREQSLRFFPWICARCGREFTRENLHELTVHHKDHNHDNNPPDGSNWENLCLYCHDQEHQKFAHLVRGWDEVVEPNRPLTYQAFAGLRDLLERGKS
jgi:5-methylcytosine-specific restriction endonuclease McrA